MDFDEDEEDDATGAEAGFESDDMICSGRGGSRKEERWGDVVWCCQETTRVKPSCRSHTPNKVARFMYPSVEPTPRHCIAYSEPEYAVEKCQNRTGMASHRGMVICDYIESGVAN